MDAVNKPTRNSASRPRFLIAHQESRGFATGPDRAIVGSPSAVQKFDGPMPVDGVTSGFQIKPYNVPAIDLSVDPTTIPDNHSGWIEYDLPGTIFSIPWATDSTALIQVQWHTLDLTDPGIWLGKNAFWGGFQWQKFFVTWSVQAAKQMRLAIWNDPDKTEQVRAV